MPSNEPLLSRLRLPRRPPSVVALNGSPFTLTATLTTDLGDHAWPDELECIALQAELLDASYRTLPLNVQLFSSALELSRGPFYSLTTKVNASRGLRSVEEAYLRISTRGRGLEASTRTKEMLELLREGDEALISEDMAVLSAIAGPIKLVSGPRATHSDDKVAMTRLLAQLPNEMLLPLVEKPELGLGSHIWDASLALSLYVLRTSSPFDGPFDILELGAGLGLSSLAALSVYNNATALLTDTADVLSSATKPTIASLPASLRSRISAQELLWTDPAPSLLQSSEKSLLVLAADVTYNTSSHSALAATMAALLTSRTETLAILAYRPRAEADEGFFELIRGRGVKTELLRGEGFGDVQIWRMRMN